MGRQWHVTGANLPDGGQLSSDVAQKRSRIIDGSEAGQTSVKLPQPSTMALVGLQMRMSDGVNGSDGDDESYNPYGEAVDLKDTV